MSKKGKKKKKRTFTLDNPPQYGEIDDDRPLYMVTETGVLEKITHADALKMAKDNKEQTIKALSDAIEEGRPFLLITCDTKEIKTESLALTSTVGSHKMPAILSILFLSIPYGNSISIVRSLEDMVTLRMLDHYFGDAIKTYVQRELLNCAIAIPRSISKISG